MLKEIQTISTLSVSSPEPTYAAEIHISDDGKFVYPRVWKHIKDQVCDFHGGYQLYGHSISK